MRNAFVIMAAIITIAAFVLAAVGIYWLAGNEIVRCGLLAESVEFGILLGAFAAVPILAFGICKPDGKQ